MDYLGRAEELVPKATILFADNDQATLGMMREWACQIGWTGEYVTSAAGIIEAVNGNCAEADQGCFDAIVADINYFGMATGPRETGITAARAIRKTGQDIPIIFCSGYLNSVIREEIRRVGATAYAKPVDLPELFLIVAKQIHWHRLTMNIAYKGPDRRANSVNTTLNRRRNTDSFVRTPRIVSQIIKEVRGEVREGHCE